MSTTISYPIVQNVGGFGVRFADLVFGDSWRLQVSNRSVGHQGYAPSGHFTVDGQPLTLMSGGDDLVEYMPPDAPEDLRLTLSRPDSRIISRQEWSGTTVRWPYYEPPRWASGMWLGGTWMNLSQETVLVDLQEVLNAQIPFVGRLIDYGWSSYEGDLFEFSSAFSRLREVIQRHRDVNLEIMLWVAPWIPVGTAQWSLFAGRGWLVKDAFHRAMTFPVVGDGSILGSYIDLSRRDAAKHWSDSIRRLFELGVRGIKLDFGEALPRGSVLSCEISLAGQVDPGNRNWFPLYAQMASLAGMTEFGFLTSRSGWLGSERVTSNWVGDQSSDNSRFAGLPSTLWALDSAHQSDYRHVGVDIGGYFGKPTDQMYRSWQRTSALFDYAVYHGLTDRAPWRQGRRALEEHSRLWSARRDIVWSASDTIEISTPSRDHFVAQRTGKDTVAVADLGESTSVRLPEGRWVEYGTATSYEGGTTHNCPGGSIFTRV